VRYHHGFFIARVQLGTDRDRVLCRACRPRSPDSPT
jgi:hypothetical protein